MPDELERLHKQLVHQQQPKKSRMADALTMRPTRLQSSAYSRSLPASNSIRFCRAGSAVLLIVA
jgi:hypothetical protein